MSIKVTHCPLCDKKVLETGLINHIVGSAKGELYELYFNRAVRRKHLDYVSKNTEVVQIEKLRLKLD
jgi:hypothetical protein